MTQLHLVYAIHRMAHEIAVALEQADFGVNQAEAHILAHVGEHGACTVAEIHRAFGHKRSTLTSVLDRLESRQLIVRVINETDRRSFIVRLTDQGVAVANEVRGWFSDLEANVSAQLTADQLTSFDAFAAAVRKATQPT